MTGKHKHDKKTAGETPPPESPAPAGGRAEPVAPARVEIDRAELERLLSQEALAAEYKDKYLRALAEGENFRKRLEKDKKDFLAYAVQDLIGELLPVLDNFERALASAPSAGPDSCRQGVEMIYKQLVGALAKEGLQQIEAKGKVFDPYLHEAVAEEVTAAAPDGSIIEELQKGYRLKDRLLRPSAVKVARSPAPPPPAAES